MHIIFVNLYYGKRMNESLVISVHLFVLLDSFMVVSNLVLLEGVFFVKFVVL